MAIRRIMWRRIMWHSGPAWPGAAWPGAGRRRSVPHRHVLEPVDEARPKPADLATGRHVAHPLGHHLQQHPEFENSQMAAQAEMRPAASITDVRVRFATNVEREWGGKNVLVPVARRIEKHDLVALGEPLAAHLGVAHDGTPEQVHRTYPPDDLLRRGGDQAWIGQQPLPLAGVLEEREHPA